MQHLQELTGQERTPEERELVDDINFLRKQAGEPPMSPQEENLCIAQARMVGDL